jgi:hypothetical protein
MGVEMGYVITHGPDKGRYVYGVATWESLWAEWSRERRQYDVRRRDGVCCDCGAPHRGEDAGDVFTPEQWRTAVGVCARCGWPEFDADDAPNECEECGGPCDPDCDRCDACHDDDADGAR